MPLAQPSIQKCAIFPRPRDSSQLHLRKLKWYGRREWAKKRLPPVPASSPPSANENVLGGAGKWIWNPAMFCLGTLDSSLTSRGPQFLHLWKKRRSPVLGGRDHWNNSCESTVTCVLLPTRVCLFWHEPRQGAHCKEQNMVLALKYRKQDLWRATTEARLIRGHVLGSALCSWLSLLTCLCNLAEQGQVLLFDWFHTRSPDWWHLPELSRLLSCRDPSQDA